jgi:diacylglycerol kinase family enzyme
MDPFAVEDGISKSIIISMQARNAGYRPEKVKLIFNPISGAQGDSPQQLMTILSEMQALNLAAEVHLLQPGQDLLPVIQEALRRRFRLFVVSGGDGTIDSVAQALAGTPAVLGIIPTGTQNNVALSLDIPGDIPAAVRLLRSGRPVKVDMGIAACGEFKQPFLEACSVGLLSALFSAADDIQHGNLARIGDLLATLVTFPTAEIHLVLDGQQEIHTQGHVVLVSNMPYLGPHYPVAPEGSFSNGLLEVIVFANQTKLELLSNVVQIAGGGTEDPRVQRYQVHRLSIDTKPPMPILVDGFPLGEGPLEVGMLHQALTVMAGG